LHPSVLLVASEAVPLAKTGGLADVITALACALIDRGIEASILMPGYPGAVEAMPQLRKIATLQSIPGGPVRLLRGCLPGTNVPVVLVDSDRFSARSANPYVDHDGEEYADNALSFASLAHAALAICDGHTALPAPAVVHANDWHAALIPALLHQHRVNNVGSLLTIHNLAFQGNYPMELAPELGITPDMLTPAGIEFWGRISFLKAGIRYADRVSTVSKSYAQEILTERFGHGMEGVLNDHEEALVAIPNGADTLTWNPASDPLIARQFSLRDMRGKSGCKRDLQNLYALPVDPFAPVLAIGSRITHQKMADVTLAALPGILERHRRLQLVVLGCGEPQYEQGFQQLVEQFPSRVGLHIGYDERRAHALHAGADMLLHGSRFEPFGLTPIYSMRYGTIPIASRVGGLIDTITDAGDRGPMTQDATGILFDGEQPSDIAGAIDRAFELFGRSGEWQALQRNAMSAEFGWSGPASEYIRLYADIAPAAARQAFLDTLSPPPVAMQEYKTA
jgi:starch synthase